MSGFGRMLRDARLSDGHYLLGLRTKSRRWAQVIDCMNILVERTQVVDTDCMDDEGDESDEQIERQLPRLS